MKRWEKMALAATFGLVASVFADNPISNYHFLADPAAFGTDDEFFILTDTDDECPNTGENDYTIRALYILSSKDMKNCKYTLNFMWFPKVRILVLTF